MKKKGEIPVHEFNVRPDAPVDVRLLLEGLDILCETKHEGHVFEF